MNTTNLFKIFFALSLSIFLISLQSCSDPCESTVCFNNGICAEGNCECPPGYTGSSCEICPPGYSGSDCSTYDSCYNVSCQNGGTCISGTCDCPPGYTGTNCENQQSPISMTITKIELTTYPTAMSSGNSWDNFPDSGPDVFVTINSGTSSNQFSFVSSEVFSNANGTMLTYTTGLPYTLSSLNSNYTVAAWDDDGSVNANDNMGGFYFEPSTRMFGRPTVLNLTGPTIAARLYVTWNY
jgi:hypothetical protein